MRSDSCLCVRLAASPACSGEQLQRLALAAADYAFLEPGALAAALGSSAQRLLETAAQAASLQDSLPLPAWGTLPPASCLSCNKGKLPLWCHMGCHAH